jgi:hypothetical protein
MFSSALCASSSEISLSFNNSLKSELASRRILRTVNIETFFIIMS